MSKKQKSTKSKAHKKEHKKHTVKKSSSKKKSNISAILALVAIVVIILVVVNIGKILPSRGGVVAVVNDQKITSEDIEWKYSKLPAETQAYLTREDLLNQTITEKLLLEEAESKGITVSEKEVSDLIDQIILESGITEQEFEDNLKARGISMKEIKQLYKEQVVIGTLINQTISGKIEQPTDVEARAYYNENLDIIGDMDYVDVRDDIITFLHMQAQQEVIDAYVLELMNKATIEIYPENLEKGAPASPSLTQGYAQQAKPGMTFQDTGDEICKQDGKPIIRLYSTTWCPHCEWIKDTYDSTVKEYVDQGKIIAYHWELDIGDDTLTSVNEGEVPQEEAILFQTYNPQGGVPTFLFGCKYLRVGNGYEAQRDLKAEEAEFRKVIEELIAS